MQRIAYSVQRIVFLMVVWSLVTGHWSLTEAATSIILRSDLPRTLHASEIDSNFRNLRDAHDSYSGIVAAQIAALQAGQAGGTLGFTTKALMDADLAHDADTLARVTNDATAGNNGIYIKLGASGAGSWQRAAFQDQPFVLGEWYGNNLNTAVAARGATKTTFIYNSDQAVTANITIPATFELMPINGAVVNHTTYTVAYAGPTGQWGRAHIFNGTGAVSGLTGYSRPEWFGSAGDGVTADNAAIQRAVNALTAGEVVLSKNYRTTGAVTLKSNVHLVGTAGNKLIPDYTSASTSTAPVNATGTLGGNITVTADIARGDTSIAVSDSSGFAVGDLVMLHDGRTTGWPYEFRIIKTVPDSTHITVATPCKTPYLTSNGIIANKISGLQNVKIRGVNFEGGTSIDAYYMVFIYYGRDIEISDCTVKNHKAAANPTNADTLVVHTSDNVSVHDNIIYGVGDASLQSSQAINLYRVGRPSIRNNVVHDAAFGVAVVEAAGGVIGNNQLHGTRGSGNRGIKVLNSQGVVTEGNTIDSFDSGYKPENSGWCQFVSNQVSNGGVGTSGVGINVSHAYTSNDHQGHLIKDNIVQHYSGLGIYLSATALNSVVDGNIVYDTGSAGINVSAPNCTIRGNRVLNSNTAAVSYGMNFHPSHSIVTGNYIQTAGGSLTNGIYSYNVSTTTETPEHCIFNGNVAPSQGMGGVSYTILAGMGVNDVSGLGMKQVLTSSTPSSGNWTRGDRTVTTAPAAGGSTYTGKVCVSSGTFGTLSGVTATTSAGSNQVTVNTTSGLSAGNYILVAGEGGNVFRILAIEGTTLLVSATAVNAVSGAAVSYAVPVFTGYGLIQ